MSLESDIRSLAGADYKICFFKDSKHTQLSSPEHHYVSLCCKNPDKFFLIMITSKVGKFDDQWRNFAKVYPTPLPEPIYLRRNYFPFLNKPRSVFDYFQVIYGNLEHIISRVHDAYPFTLKKDAVPIELRAEIYTKIQLLPMIDTRWKSEILP